MNEGGAAATTALLLLVVQIAAAPEYGPAGITVAQLFERNRHSVGSFQPGSYHVTARTVSQNGDIWTSETFWSGNDYRATVAEGSFVRSYGEYRGLQWHQDANGLVMPSSDLFEEVDPFAVALRQAEDPISGVEIARPDDGFITHARRRRYAERWIDRAALL